MEGISPDTVATSSSSLLARGPPGVAAPKRKGAELIVGAGAGAGAGAACTTNMADALMDDVLAVMVRFPVAAAGIVMPVLNAPAEVVWNEKVVEPTITDPVDEALNPVPVTVTAEPAGPEVGLSKTCGDVVAALAGWMTDTANPTPIMSATNNDLSIRNTAIYPQIERRQRLPPVTSMRKALALILWAENRTPIKKTTILAESSARSGEQS